MNWEEERKNAGRAGQLNEQNFQKLLKQQSEQFYSQQRRTEGYQYTANETNMRAVVPVHTGTKSETSVIKWLDNRVSEICALAGV